MLEFQMKSVFKMTQFLFPSTQSVNTGVVKSVYENILKSEMISFEKLEINFGIWDIVAVIYEMPSNGHSDNQLSIWIFISTLITNAISFWVIISTFPSVDSLLFFYFLHSSSQFQFHSFLEKKK